MYCEKIRLEVKQEKNNWTEKEWIIPCTREDEVRSTKEEAMRVWKVDGLGAARSRLFAEVANEGLEGKISQLLDQILRNLVQYKRVKI